MARILEEYPGKYGSLAEIKGNISLDEYVYMYSLPRNSLASLLNREIQDREQLPHVPVPEDGRAESEV